MPQEAENVVHTGQGQGALIADENLPLMGVHNEILKAAREYVRRGRRVVPVPRRRKGPRLRGWQKLRLTEADLPEYFRGDRNIGLLVGEPSGGLVDLDLDSPEAIGAAETWLPATGLIHGRPGKPSSHWWYRCDPIPKSERFEDIDGTCLLEVRSSGEQTIVPPSQHPSGERLRWESEEDPIDTDGGELAKRAASLAAAILFGRHWPAKGSRHDAALATAGVLARAVWAEEEALKFIREVCRVAGDEELEDRQAAVRSTFEKLARGQSVTGALRLSELVGQAVLKRLFKYLRLGPQKESGLSTLYILPQFHRQIRAVILHEGTPTFDKRREVSHLIEEELGRLGRFLRTSDGRGFFFHNGERQLYDLSQTPFQYLVTALSGLSATETYFKFTLDVLQARASRGAPLVDLHTFAHFDAGTGLLAVSGGAGSIWVRERGAKWRNARNGDNGLLFLTEPDATPWEPEFEPNGRSREWFLGQFLFANEPLSLEDSQTLLYLWLAQQFFPPLRRTRAIPAFLGPQGSGKTTGLRMIGRLFLGPNFDVTGLQRDREDAFVAAVTNRVVLGLDNADSKIPWLADALALYATGQRYRFRRLYTTNEEVSYSPRAILMISSRDPRFNRADVSERLLPLYFRRPESYHTEEQIFRELDARRGAVMGSLLAHVGEIADALPGNPPTPLPFRMADFACFGQRVFDSLAKSTEWLALLHRLEHAQTGFASEGDGLVTGLGEVLRSETQVIDMPVGELFKRCRKVAEEQGLSLPRTTPAFGRHLTTMRRVIELELEVKFSDRSGHAGSRLITLTRRNGDGGGEGGDSRQKVSSGIGNGGA